MLSYVTFINKVLAWAIYEVWRKATLMLELKFLLSTYLICLNNVIFNTQMFSFPFVVLSFLYHIAGFA